MKNMIVIENFYRDPLAVRNYALNKASYLPREKLSPKFAGSESAQSFFSPAVVQKMEAAIGEKIIVDPAHFSFGVFAKTFASDDRKKKIHVDSSDWTALLYLSRPEDCRGGTIFYEDIQTGWNAVPPPEVLKAHGFSGREHFVEEYLQPRSQNYEHWKVSTRVGMKFNRMLLFRAGSLFHAAEGYFGENDENCRLIQLFFFKTARGN